VFLFPPYRSDTSIGFFLGVKRDTGFPPLWGEGQESSRSGAYEGGWVWEEKQYFKKVAGKDIKRGGGIRRG